jgi:glycosyltransferase involved in cell wall biosynthesis
VDLPPWARFWKRGRRGLHLYYLLWQLAALRKAKRLHAEFSFDLVWHLTMANVWFGSAASLLRIPFVYGPVGGGAKVSWKLLSVLGLRGAGYELLRSLAALWGRYINPLARISWRRAQLILVQNEETRLWLPKSHRHKAEMFVNIIFDSLPPPRERRGNGKVALFAGNLFPFKGGTLALQTMKLLPDWKLLIVGTGSDERRLRRLTRRLDIEDRVEFRPWQERDRLFAIMQEEADLLLFPSLHDQGPWVVAEALSCGLRVVALKGGASSAIGAHVVAPASVRETTEALAASVRESSAYSLAPATFDLDSRHDELRTLLERYGVLPARTEKTLR